MIERLLAGQMGYAVNSAFLSPRLYLSRDHTLQLRFPLHSVFRLRPTGQDFLSAGRGDSSGIRPAVYDLAA